MNFLQYGAASNPRTVFETSMDLFIFITLNPTGNTLKQSIFAYIHEPVNSNSLNYFQLQ